MSMWATALRSRWVVAGPVLLGVALTVAACGGDGGYGGDAAGMAPTTASSSHHMDGMSMGPSPTYPSVAPGPTASGANNAADANFATQMVTHHGQAVVMADMLLSRSSNSQVKALAERIKTAQTPEIAAMAGWLKGWGKSVPDPYAPMSGDMAGMGHGGMMSQEQMDQLDSAMGMDADKAFLTLMQLHHQGAIDMATAELQQGTNPEAKALAQKIITSQTSEITEMKGLLAALN